MTDQKFGIIYCPKQRWNERQRKTRYEEILKAEGIDYELLESENPSSVEPLVRRLIAAKCKNIVVIGGDSALNDAVNCLMLEEASVRESTCVGLIPHGVMDDFARFWGASDYDYERAIKALAAHKVRKIDVGCIRYTNKRQERCRRYFLNCVNIGLVARIMDIRRRTRHLFGSRTLSFVSSFILLLFQRMDFKVSMALNDERVSRRVMTICVGNARGYGLTPNAVPYNGLLDVSVVSSPKTMQLFRGIGLFLQRRLLNHKSVMPYRTREIEFESTQHAQVSIDGRLMRTPVGGFKINVEKEMINFIVPS